MHKIRTFSVGYLKKKVVLKLLNIIMGLVISLFGNVVEIFGNFLRHLLEIGVTLS